MCIIGTNQHRPSTRQMRTIAGQLSLSGKSAHVAGRIDSRLHPVASLKRGRTWVIGPCKIGTIDGHLNHNISQRSGVVSGGRGIIRIPRTVTH